jgi:hypothetical protein
MPIWNAATWMNGVGTSAAWRKHGRKHLGSGKKRHPEKDEKLVLVPVNDRARARRIGFSMGRVLLAGLHEPSFFRAS